MKYLPDLFARNRKWAASQTRHDPEFFRRLAEIQRPEYLWIGCSDSRVPANDIVGLRPGELFVHRNVANLVRADDPNCMAVVDFAVTNLGVRHVIVCGHYGCGGVRAALEGSAAGVVRQWLEPLTRLAESRHAEELRARGDRAAAWSRLCELNVMAQVAMLATTPAVQKRWADGAFLALHGWIYDIRDGLLADLEVTLIGQRRAP